MVSSGDCEVVRPNVVTTFNRGLNEARPSRTASCRNANGSYGHHRDKHPLQGLLIHKMLKGGGGPLKIAAALFIFSFLPN